MEKLYVSRVLNLSLSIRQAMLSTVQWRSVRNGALLQYTPFPPCIVLPSPEYTSSLLEAIPSLNLRVLVIHYPETDGSSGC
jgi:hypothetical protein